MDKSPTFSFNSTRRFGAEIELNSFDLRDFKTFPLRDGEHPEGIHYVADLIANFSKNIVEIKNYHTTHNNTTWVLKSDSSCGIEVCSPVTSGWAGIKEICEVIDLFSRDKSIIADSRCSLHLHVNVLDLTDEEIASVLIYWIKSENIFFSSIPQFRKNSSFCKSIGSSTNIDTNLVISPSGLVKLLGEYKYNSINTYHLSKKTRPTIEFRLIGNDGCLDPFIFKNWTRLILLFVDKTKNLPYSDASFRWIDLNELMNILDLDKEISPGLKEIRNWFLSRIIENSGENKLYSINKQQAFDFVKLYNIDTKNSLHCSDYERLYDCNLIE